MIRSELNRASIPIVKYDGEVPSTIGGRLDDFAFVRWPATFTDDEAAR